VTRESPLDCPLGVASEHRRSFTRCLLHLRKRTISIFLCIS
jgi:hypothetical protein